MKKLISKITIVLILGTASIGTVLIPVIHTVYAADQTDNTSAADKDNNSDGGSMGNMDMSKDQ